LSPHRTMYLWFPPIRFRTQNCGLTFYSLKPLEGICGTTHPLSSTVQDVGVDHCHVHARSGPNCVHRRHRHSPIPRRVSERLVPACHRACVRRGPGFARLPAGRQGCKIAWPCRPPSTMHTGHRLLRPPRHATFHSGSDRRPPSHPRS
jgi:hypothetical protein